MNASEQLADVARRLQAEGVEGCSEKHAGLAFRFMAPLATTFACWVLGRVKAQGIKRLYFLSRDCQLILQAARRLAPQFGGIDCRYLQVSRQALFLPSTSDISEEGMPWLFENTDRHVLDSQLAKLEISFEEFAPFFREGAETETVLESEEDIRAFWFALNQPPLREKLTALIDERRRAARQYFEESGLFDSVKWAVVDIGWLLRCQRALNELLRSMGRNEDVLGFYLGAQAEREPEKLTGPANALFYNQTEGVSPIVFKQVILIENLFCTADHPTVHRYESGPCYNREVHPATLERFQSLEKAFSAFAERCAGFAMDLADPETAAELVEHLIDGFLNNPVAEIIRPLEEIEVSFLQNDLNAFPMVRPLNWREALAPAFPQRTFLKPLWKGPRVIWHCGSVAVSRPWIQQLYFFAYRIRSVRMRFKWLR